MQIHFDVEFDGGAWPGALVGREAVAGEAWVGPRGLLVILETRLGLLGRWPSVVERTSALVPALRAMEGFWSRTAEVDPLGAARTLLGWRDELILAGLRSVVGVPRVDALIRVTGGVLPGIADRWVRVLNALEERQVEIEYLGSYGPTAGLPLLWRRVLDRLAHGGTAVSVVAPEPVASAGDLGAARTRPFAPTQDGTLQLLRAQGPLQCAEELSAWLAALEDLSGTVIVSPDGVLDEALQRHGLPTLGALNVRGQNALLQVLPLVLSLGWSPQDPQRALELLTLPVGPVPRNLAAKLARALHEWPAIGSDDWCEALKSGLSEIPEERRPETATRVAAIFRAGTPLGEDAYPATEIRSRVDLVACWLRGRMVGWEGNPAPFVAALGQCSGVRDGIDRAELEAVSSAQLQRYLSQATDDVTPTPNHVAQAGLEVVSSPGAIVGPVRNVIWWNFDAESARPHRSMGLLREHRAALEAVGVELPDPGDAALLRAGRWRRPLLLARESLLLVCPQRGDDGEARHPHPLWDEIQANAQEAGVHVLLVQQLNSKREVSRQVRERRQLPQPTPIFRPQTVIQEGRQTESPSGIAALLGCPLNWVLRYQGQVRGGETGALAGAESKQLLGSLVHRVMQTLLERGVASPETAGTLAAGILDAEGPRVAAPLFLPGNESILAMVRQVTRDAATVLIRTLQHAGGRVRSVERAYTTDVDGQELRGTPDLVLDTPRVVLDFKWSGANFRREQMKQGQQYQLAAYAHLVRREEGDAELPPAGYFILEKQQLLIDTPGVFAEAEVVQGPALEDVWSGLALGRTASFGVIAGGEIRARGAGAVPDEQVAAEGVLELEPPCRFCEYGLLCGRDFGELEE